MNTPGPAPRSNFVTVLAWTMIAFGAFSILMCLTQLVLAKLLQPALGGGMPLPRLFGESTLAFIRTAMLFGLAWSAGMTYVSWALLQRQNWARILYIALFIVGAVLHLVGIWALGSLGTMLTYDSLPPGFDGTLSILTVAVDVLLVTMAVGYGWLAYRLCTPAIAAEFKATAAAV